MIAVDPAMSSNGSGFTPAAPPAAPTAAPAVAADDLRDMVRENLVAERIAIDSYREMINFIGDRDTTTKRILEEILAQEEEHADEFADLLDGWIGE